MKFVAEAMVETTTKWDYSQKKFVECEPMLTNPCGSDYTVIISDLKLARSAINRISKMKWPKNTLEVRIFSTNNVCAPRQAYHLLKTFKEGEFQKFTNF